MGERIEPSFEGNTTFARKQPFRLAAGGKLHPVTVHYATYGELNARRDNAVLVCHALSGSARVGDWWPEMLGPGKPFDIERFFVVCTNAIGSCYGSTGPTSTRSRTGVAYGPEFPLVSIEDIVRAQAHVLDRLGIGRLHTVAGGSIGGMQALQWAVDFPDRVGRCIAVGAAPLAPMGLALNHIQREAIRLDPAWRGGRYSDESPPSRGLGLARALAMCSYKSAGLFDERFGRAPNRNGEDPYSSADGRFDVAGYLDYQATSFVGRFDANTYIALSKAMDTFALDRRYGSEFDALARISACVLLIGISSDWLFPSSDVKALAARMKAAGVSTRYEEFVSDHGHDAFLAEADRLADQIKGSWDRSFAACA